MKLNPIPLISLAFIAGCAEPEKKQAKNLVPTPTVVYKRDREFTFIASHYDDKGSLTMLDTLIFSTSGRVMNEEYGQTESRWASPSGRFNTTMPGITENDTTVWLHPPRQQEYMKLELSPFPMVALPLKVGSEWKWDLMVGGHYSVKGHAEWEGHGELFASNYRITRQVPLNTALGIINTFEVEGKADSRFGQTGLRSYYSPEYGFVRLEYRNIDKGRITMEMVGAKNTLSEGKLSFKDVSMNSKSN